MPGDLLERRRNPQERRFTKGARREIDAHGQPCRDRSHQARARAVGRRWIRHTVVHFLRESCRHGNRRETLLAEDHPVRLVPPVDRRFLRRSVSATLNLESWISNPAPRIRPLFTPTGVTDRSQGWSGVLAAQPLESRPQYPSAARAPASGVRRGRRSRTPGKPAPHVREH